MSVRGIFRDSDIVLTLGNVTLFLSGIVLLCATSVVQTPFRDFPLSVQIGFSVMVGFYIFKSLLDTVHYNHFTAYGIPTVHHILTITLYMVFLMKRQNALCGILGLVFQADAVFIDTSKLLSNMDKDENELVNFTWKNKFIGATVTFSTRLILPAIFITISFTKSSIFTMDLIVVMFYFLSLVFFSIWNLLMFHNAVIGCVRYSHRLKAMACRRAIEGPPNAVDRQLGHQTSSSRLWMKHNDLRRLPPCSNTNIATPRKQSERLNNLKIPKMPITEAIGQLHTGEPSQSRQQNFHRVQSSTPVDLSSSDYDPSSSISDVEENSVRYDDKYHHRFETISCSTSDTSSNHVLTDVEQAVTHDNTIVDNTLCRQTIPSNIYHSYVQIDGHVYLERKEDGSPEPSDSTDYMPREMADPESRQKGNTKATQQRQRRTNAVHLTASETILTAQLAQTDNTSNKARATCSKNVLDGIHISNSIQQTLRRIPDMSSYPQFGENQSI